MKVKSSRGIAVACCTASLVSASKAALSQKLRIRNMGLAALYCTLLLFSGAPAWADPCNAPTVGTPAGSFTSDPTGSCGFVITITGGSGSLAATILPGSSGPYDGAEDQLVGIQNTSTATVGAIVLKAPATTPSSPFTDNLFKFEGDGPCSFNPTTDCFPNPPITGYTSTGYEGPDNTFIGISSDFTTGKVLFTTPLIPGATTWFALENTPVSVVAIGENKALTAGVEATFPFGTGGVDDYKIKPLNSVSGDSMTITPIPVPSGSFSASNFPNLRCIAYKDFSSVGNPVCVEIERDCSGSGCAGLLYTAQLDFNIDGNSLPNGIGGPSFLGQHGVACPTSGFDLNILVTYIGAVVDPLKGGGSGGGSCWVAAFDPDATPIATNAIFSPFVGFQSPVSDTDLNLVKPGQSVALIWQLFSSPGVPLVENLHVCGSATGSGCDSIKPWVFIGTIKTTCMADSTPNLDTETTQPAGSSNLQNFQNGTYQYNLKTVKSPSSTGCFDAVLIFDSGLTVFPANFKFKP